MKTILFAILLAVGDSVNAEFTCQQEGAFANPDASGCESYIYCDSSLQPSIQNCPTNSYFWPLHQGCFSDYNCAEDSTPDGDNTNPCADWKGFSIIDKYSTDCSSYLYCERSFLTGATHGIRNECPSGTFYQFNWGCRENYQCSNYHCTAEGTFPDPTVNDCSRFVKCIKYKNPYSDATALFPKFITCPANTKFSLFSNKCDEFYTCGGSNPHPKGDPCANYNRALPTAKKPHSNNCKTFLSCRVISPNGDVIDVIVKQTCPANTFFSPTIGKCYYNHVCNESCSKDPCSNGVGRFVDYDSGDCKGFVECQDDSTIQGVYKPTYEKRYCPPGTLFSLQKRDCVRNYNCPTFPVNYCYEPISTTPPPVPSTTPYMPTPEWVY